MREIKFRAWLNKLDVMLPPEEICYIAFTEGNGVIVHGFAEPIRDVYEDVTLMQYTNSDDKHKKLIYDGDILDSYGGAKYEVFWNHGEWMTRRLGKLPTVRLGQQVKSVEPLTKWNLMMFEVIGNIHENSELLE